MDFSMDSLNSYVDQAKTASGSNLSGKIKNTGSASSAEELKEACREFESYFMEQVYKEVFKNIGTNDTDSSLGMLVDYYKDNTIQALASQTTDQTGGVLAQQLYEQMKRNYGITEE